MTIIIAVKKYVNLFTVMFLPLIVIVSPAMHSDVEISSAICEKNRESSDLAVID